MIKFNAEDHSYIDEDNNAYISVSQLIALYKKPYDADKFSFLIAKKRGISQDVVKAEWKQKNDDANIFGKSVHSIVEDYIKTQQIRDENIINKFLEVFDHKLSKVRSEDLLYNTEFKVAGTSDIIVDIDSEFFDVYDVKTNGKFDFYSKYGEMLLKPLDRLQNCKYSTYGIQLSLYAWLYSKLTGKTPRKLTILYWDRKEFKEYVVPYMFWEVSVLLKHYSESKR